MLMFGGSCDISYFSIFIVFILTSCIRIVPQAQALVRTSWSISGNIWRRYPFYGAVY